MPQTAPVSEVLAAVRCVLTGEVYLSLRVQGHLIGRMSGGQERFPWETWEALNDRELELMLLMMEGSGMREASVALGIKLKTAEMYRANIVRKLGLAGRQELAIKALQWREWVFRQ